MGKFIASILLLFFLGAYAVATIPELTKKTVDSGLVMDAHNLGDLYFMSRLSEFKKEREHCSHFTQPMSSKKKVKFFLLGDSFSEFFVGQNFCSDEYIFNHWKDQTNGVIDSSCINVLVIESVERNVRDRFKEAKNDNLMVRRGNSENIKLRKFYGDSYGRKFNKYFFGQDIIETNLELVLFDNALFRKLKEIKANINRHFFDRIDSKVVLSQEKHQLYLDAEAKTELKLSSFNTVDEKEISLIARNMNQMSEYYKKMGFDKVIFSFIPNKVSIIEPGQKYNHLVSRIQSCGERNFDIIDAYSILQPMGESGYMFNDTHWGCTGRNAWIDSVNVRLKSIAYEHY